MISQLRPALILLLLFAALTGLVYPLVITGIAQIAFPHQASGSLIVKDGTVIGSALIGQPFTSDKYFWGRPSATSGPDPKDLTKSVPNPYNAANSSGSNLGATSKSLMERVTGDVEKLRGDAKDKRVPVDLATASGSGLDPHITPAAALYQAPRVAEARGMDEAAVRQLVESRIDGRVLGFLGEPRINVLLLNLALDEAADGRSSRP